MAKALPVAANGHVVEERDAYAINVTINDAVLRRVVAAIFADANGRTCSSCIHFRGNWCSANRNINGEPLSIFYENAPACGAHAVAS